MNKVVTERQVTSADTTCVRPLHVDGNSAFGELLGLCKSSVSFDNFTISGAGIPRLGPGTGNVVATNLPPAYVERVLGERWLEENAVPVACREASVIARPMDILKVACRNSLMMARLVIRSSEYGLSVPYAVPVSRAGKVVGGVMFERATPFSEREEQFLQLIASPLHREALNINPPNLEKHTISARELECLRLSGDGKTNNEIAEDLQLSPQTIAFHIRNCCTKLGALNKSSAVAEAIRQGLME